MLKIKNVKTTQEFYIEIETMVSRGFEYIDAITTYCEKRGVDIEVASSMVKALPKLKHKLQIEAENLNRIQKTARLPE
jgi:hypothetical protein